MRTLCLLTLTVLSTGCGTMTQDVSLPDFDKLWNYDDPAATEQKLRGLVPGAESSGDRSYHAQLLTQLARTQGLQGKFEEGHTILDEVEKMLTDDLETARIRYLLERGRTFNSSGEKQKARPLFLEALERAQAAGEDFHAVDAAHMMAIIEPVQKQLSWNLEALKLAEEATDPRTGGWRGALYNNIGWTFHDQEKFEEALGMFEKGLAFRQQLKQEGAPILIARWSIARTLRSLGRIAEALETQEALLEEWKAHGGEHGYVSEELGECLLALGRDETARPHFARAHELISKDQWLVKNQPDRLKRLARLGKE